MKGYLTAAEFLQGCPLSQDSQHHIVLPVNTSRIRKILIKSVIRSCPLNLSSVRQIFRLKRKEAWFLILIHPNDIEKISSSPLKCPSISQSHCATPPTLWIFYSLQTITEGEHGQAFSSEFIHQTAAHFRQSPPPRGAFLLLSFVQVIVSSFHILRAEEWVVDIRLEWGSIELYRRAPPPL